MKTQRKKTEDPRPDLPFFDVNSSSDMRERFVRTDCTNRHGQPHDLTDPGTTTWTRSQYREWHGINDDAGFRL